MQWTTHRTLLAGLLCLTLLAGCNSDSSSGSSGYDSTDNAAENEPEPNETGTDDLVLEWTSPEAGQSLGAREPLVARFNQALDAGAITETVFWVETDSGDRLYGDVSLQDDGHELKLVLDETLQLLTDYDAVVHRDLKSEAGYGLDDHLRWTFRTRDIAWSEAELLAPAFVPDDLDPSDFYPVSSRVELNRDGVGMMAWTESRFQETSDIHLRHHDPVLGWSEPDVVSELADERHSVPRFNVDDAGNALLVWDIRRDNPDPDADRSFIYNQRYRYYSAEEGWSDAGDGPREESTTRFGAMLTEPLGDGRFIGHFRQNDEDGVRQWYYMIFDPDTGWSTDTVPLPHSAADLESIRLTTNNQGRILFTWHKRRGDEDHGVWLLEYQEDDGWSDARRMLTWESGGVGTFNMHSLVLEDDGRAGLVWEERDEHLGKSVLWSALRDPDMGWGQPEQVTVAGSNEHDNYALLTFGPGGETLLLTQAGGFRSSTLRARRYEPGQGWQSPDIIGRNQHGSNTGLKARWGDDGALILVSRQNTEHSSLSQRDIIVRRYHPDHGWNNGSFLGHIGDGSYPLAFALPTQGPRIIMVWAYQPSEDGEPDRILSSQGY
ncbi:MAG: Ig-like domain-containing protein [Natronospirillum sp.]|uniref:Ig-like domain-containing protein n=1 Tax=Natronospirillum sp. TaxID=2812955 RepID=UPI0025DF4F82|nr:Ig-like domain-containing protein [Natronospirillum sp.]MCH8551177.1 Ig-like domain-containing protein [Natronospirillum sp.]